MGVSTVGLFEKEDLVQRLLDTKKQEPPSTGAATSTEEGQVPPNTSSIPTSLTDEIRAMRAKEIKAELMRLGVSTVGLFEKEDLVQRLLETKKQGPPYAGAATKEANSISAPLYFTDLDTDLKVAAVNIDGGLQVNPSEKPYPTVKVNVRERG